MPRTIRAALCRRSTVPASSATAWRRRLAARLCDGLLIHDAGWASLDPAILGDAAPAAALALAWLLQTLGGTEYPIAPERRTEALEQLRDPAQPGFTLGGCYLSFRSGRLLVCRDWGAAGGAAPVHPGMRVLWDRRFVLEIPGDFSGEPGFTIARLGERGIQSLGRDPEKRRPEPEMPSPLPPARPCPPYGKGSGWRRFRISVTARRSQSGSNRRIR